MILISQHPANFTNIFYRFYKQVVNNGEGVVNSGGNYRTLRSVILSYIEGGVRRPKRLGSTGSP